MEADQETIEERAAIAFAESTPTARPSHLIHPKEYNPPLITPGTEPGVPGTVETRIPGTLEKRASFYFGTSEYQYPIREVAKMAGRPLEEITDLVSNARRRKDGEEAIILRYETATHPGIHLATHVLKHSNYGREETRANIRNSLPKTVAASEDDLNAYIKAGQIFAGVRVLPNTWLQRAAVEQRFTDIDEDVRDIVKRTLQSQFSLHEKERNWLVTAVSARVNLHHNVQYALQHTTDVMESPFRKALHNLIGRQIGETISAIKKANVSMYEFGKDIGDFIFRGPLQPDDEIELKSRILYSEAGVALVEVATTLVHDGRPKFGRKEGDLLNYGTYFIGKMIKDSGQMGVPVIEIKGTIIVGFDENAIKKALEE